MKHALASGLWTTTVSAFQSKGPYPRAGRLRPADKPRVGWPRTFNSQIGLADVIGKIEATILIGLSTVGGAFSEAIVREMARKVQRPIVFPLSNPTAKSEATADDLIRWTDGRALIATGSPFAPVGYADAPFPIAQCNNIFIFPAMGLGLIASGRSASH